MKFQAVAFDLDGTLYPNYSFALRVLPFALKEQRYLRAFSGARNRSRREGLENPGAAEDPACAGNLNGNEDGLSFYRRQAAYMGEILKADPAFLLERTEKLIYRGWEPLFKKIKLFPHVKEILAALREKGVKLGLLSDFPPEIKLEYLGLSGLWDTVLCSETIGELKPHPLPFRELSSQMGLHPREILYVGNSFHYDVIGAAGAGMNTAWIKRKIGPGNTKKERKAGFVFYNYRQLYDYVIT